MLTPEADTINIVVLIALPEEHDIFLEMFPSAGDVSTDTLVRLTHDFGVSGHTLTSVLAANMGADLAGSATYAACEDLHPDLVVCVGIAGSLSDDLNLGDVAVSNEIVDILHNSKVGDAGKRGGVRSELSPRNYTVDTALQASCRFLRSHPGLKGHFAGWVQDSRDRRDKVAAQLSPKLDFPGLDLASDPTFQVGPIVCGPVVVSKALARQLKELNRKVLAVENESGGIFRVCQEKGIPAITIRGISDHADPNKKRLEAVAKNLFRDLAMQNAIAFFEVLTRNPGFMNVPKRHSEMRQNGVIHTKSVSTPEKILRKVADEIEQTLQDASVEYKNRPNDAPLPIPRVQKLVFDEDFGEVDDAPMPLFEAISIDGAIFIKVARSYPEPTIAWSMAQSLLKQDLRGKQILPIVIDGAKIAPPKNGVEALSGINICGKEIAINFSPVLIVSDPPFASRSKIRYLIKELKALTPSTGVVIVTKAETPLEQIDQLKAELSLTDYFTTSVPFGEIAAYLEGAFEMCAGEADAVAAKLDETFSKFRLNTHPAYFIGIQETSLTALINANQRGELIQLAVAGLLLFVVASDKSAVPLTRTTREEFLRELAYQIRVEKRIFKLADLVTYAEDFAKQRALEIDALSFLKGFLDIGLLNDVAGYVTFSLQFVESYLLSEKLKSDPSAAARYFNPVEDDFDGYTFDLYCERGADQKVITEVIDYARDVLSESGNDKDVYLTDQVRPVALATPHSLVDMLKTMENAVEKMASESTSDRVRLEKQRLIDARDTVRQVVGQKKQDRSKLSDERKLEFRHLDRLSRAGVLLATMIGSGAERLTGEVKHQAAALLITASERFLHHWTLNRLHVDFTGIRKDLLSDKHLDKIISQFELFDEDREKVRQSLDVFVTDQELKTLSTPLAVVLSRLASYGGVRSLKPVVHDLKPRNEVEALLRGSWYMEVDAADGKKALKAALRGYKGADLFRFVLANHFMWRVFWHHWQLRSRMIFIDAAKTIMKGLGLLTGKQYEQKMLAGHEADQ